MSFSNPEIQEPYYIKYTPVNFKSTLSSINLDSSLDEVLPINQDTYTTDQDIITQIEDWDDFTNPLFSENNPPAQPQVKIPTNINLQGWDINKTLQHLRKYAHSKSTHLCAKAVRLALEAGGLVGFRVPNAKDEVNLHTLETIGFKPIAEAVDNKVTEGYVPQPGDISISYKNGNHASMFDGNIWISDFTQKNLDVYGNLKGTKSIIYRRLGTNTGVSSKQSGGIFEKARQLAINHKK